MQSRQILFLQFNLTFVISFKLTIFHHVLSKVQNFVEMFLAIVRDKLWHCTRLYRQTLPVPVSRTRESLDTGFSVYLSEINHWENPNFGFVCLPFVIIFLEFRSSKRVFPYIIKLPSSRERFHVVLHVHACC